MPIPIDVARRRSSLADRPCAFSVRVLSSLGASPQMTSISFAVTTYSPASIWLWRKVITMDWTD
jgi:hypothetical protein